MNGVARKPTHQCKRCGALWILYEGLECPWSLFSQKCGPCCDNVEMKDQIEELYRLRFLVWPIASMMQFFEFNHLPAHLAAVSWPFAELAWKVAAGPQNAETTVALRKLLEAKDCAVRSILMN